METKDTEAPPEHPAEEDRGARAGETPADSPVPDPEPKQGRPSAEDDPQAD